MWASFVDHSSDELFNVIHRIHVPELLDFGSIRCRYQLFENVDIQAKALPNTNNNAHFRLAHTDPSNLIGPN